MYCMHLDISLTCVWYYCRFRELGDSINHLSVLLAFINVHFYTVIIVKEKEVH